MQTFLIELFDFLKKKFLREFRFYFLAYLAEILPKNGKIFENYGSFCPRNFLPFTRTLPSRCIHRPDLVHYRIDWSRGACRGDTHPASRAREVYSFSEIRTVELATDEISDQNFDNLDWMQFNKQCY